MSSPKVRAESQPLFPWGADDVTAGASTGEEPYESAARSGVEDATGISQSALRQLCDSSIIGLVVADAEGRVTSANDAYLGMTGCSRAELTLGAVRWDRITPPEYRESDARALDELARTGSVKRVEKEYLRADGTRVAVLIGVTRIDGSVTDTISFVIDDTPRWRANEALRQLKAQIAGMISEERLTLAANREQAASAHSALANSEQQLHSLMASLQPLREQERTDLAREIHDVLGQDLTGLRLDVAWVLRRLPEGRGAGDVEARDRLKTMQLAIDGIAVTVERICNSLRPGLLDHVGLGAALEWQASEFETRAGISVHMKVPEVEIAIEGPRATALFRIFQELLTNVARHARAHHVSGSLSTDGHMLVLEVSDDGRGITGDEALGSRSLGLLGIRERVRAFGGSLTLAGLPEQGTRATVRIPLRDRDVA